jgi:hypothetical protein
LLAIVLTPDLFYHRVKRAGMEACVLVFPAASRPNIKSRISLDPKILFIILDIDAPILSVCCYLHPIAVLRLFGGGSFTAVGWCAAMVVVIAPDSGTRGLLLAQYTGN